MNENEEIVLKGVNEYCEGDEVTLIMERVNVEKCDFVSSLDLQENPNAGELRLCVQAVNEGGYNSTCVDAEQLYKALKNYFENEQQEK